VIQDNQRVAQQIGAQLNRDHQFELQQRQAASKQSLEWSLAQQQLQQQQQLIDAIKLQALSSPRITTTRCNYFGNTLSCSHH